MTFITPIIRNPTEPIIATTISCFIGSAFSPRIFCNNEVIGSNAPEACNTPISTNKAIKNTIISHSIPSLIISLNSVLKRNRPNTAEIKAKNATSIVNLSQLVRRNPPNRNTSKPIDFQMFFLSFIPDQGLILSICSFFSLDILFSKSFLKTKKDRLTTE